MRNELSWQYGNFIQLMGPTDLSCHVMPTCTQRTSATSDSNSTNEGSDLSWVCYVCGFGFGFGFFVHLYVGGGLAFWLSVFDV